ncbi:hypothetical protein CALVIDRAFT_31376 [Calocera viscosa TUFC12733]|uniref:Uncharacterized protein n=1 Tax=Calocera viscosa (strain TUFC12733) TaxID=1330018 RepID=A0A167PDW3_CALVF|nr:hypothetical protein CALVIDRAFT_31376 [Calocera viscosa TUFC12733]
MSQSRCATQGWACNFRLLLPLPRNRLLPALLDLRNPWHTCPHDLLCTTRVRCVLAAGCWISGSRSQCAKTLPDVAFHQMRLPKHRSATVLFFTVHEWLR